MASTATPTADASYSAACITAIMQMKADRSFYSLSTANQTALDAVFAKAITILVALYTP